MTGLMAPEESKEIRLIKVIDSTIGRWNLKRPVIDGMPQPIG